MALWPLFVSPRWHQIYTYAGVCLITFTQPGLVGFVDLNAVHLWLISSQIGSASSFRLMYWKNDMEHTTPLRHLPDGITIPDYLQDRLTYDRERGRISYRGFMSKRAYDELISLADDLEYRRAVEQLFVLSADEANRVEASAARLPVRALIAVGIVLLACVVAQVVTHSMSVDSEEHGLDRDEYLDELSWETVSTN